MKLYLKLHVKFGVAQHRMLHRPVYHVIVNSIEIPFWNLFHISQVFPSTYSISFLGGAISVIIYSTIFNGKIKTALSAQLSTAAINAGLPASTEDALYQRVNTCCNLSSERPTAETTGIARNKVPPPGRNLFVSE